MDETAVTCAIGPTHQYVPIDQYRAVSTAGTTDKLKITTIVTVNGIGEYQNIFC